MIKPIVKSPLISGSCLCGSVTYEITGPISDVIHCHCITCRKAHGSAFSSVAGVQDSDFKLSHLGSLKSYESSAGKHRFFCYNCGSQVYAKRDHSAHVILRLGTLDSDLSSSEKEHIWGSQKANWYEINSQLPVREES